MQEIELKFLVPPSRLKGLMRQTQVKSSQVTQLAAHYYDTADQRSRPMRTCKTCS